MTRQQNDEHVIFSRIAGTSFRQPWIKLLRDRGKSKRLHLVREPTNPADPNAVAVYARIPDHGWHHIGYLTRRVAREVAEHLDEGFYAYAQITEFTGGTEDKPTIGINIEIVLTSSKEFPPFHIPFLIPPEPYAFPRAGFFAPSSVKQFFKAVNEYLSGHYTSALRLWNDLAPHEPTAALFAALHYASNQHSDSDELRQATALLAPLIQQQKIPTPLMDKLNLHILLPIPSDLLPISPDEPIPPTLPMFALVLAGLHFRLQQKDEAIQLLSHFSRTYPDNLLLSLALARAYNADGKYEHTLNLLSEIDFSQKDPIVLALLEAYVLAFLQQEEYRPALHILSQSNYSRKSSLSPPLFQRLRFLHAKALWGSGKKSRAIEMLEQLRAENPNFPNLRNTLQEWRKAKRKSAKSRTQKKTQA